MQQGRIKHFLVLILKTILGFAVYIFFLFNTHSIYEKAKVFVSENFYDSMLIVVGQTSVRVKVADSESERITGLSGTEKINKDRGILFVFDEEGENGIWMKDMNYSIDIIWFDKYGEVVYIKENARPESYPEVFKSKKPSMYILEVNSGFVRENEIRIGDTIDLY